MRRAYTRRVSLPTAHSSIPNKIALEEHVVVPSLSAPGAAGSTADVNDPTYFSDVRARLADATMRLEDMDRCGIETMVLSLSQPGIQASRTRRKPWRPRGA